MLERRAATGCRGAHMALPSWPPPPPQLPAGQPQLHESRRQHRIFGAGLMSAQPRHVTPATLRSVLMLETISSELPRTGGGCYSRTLQPDDHPQPSCQDLPDTSRSDAQKPSRFTPSFPCWQLLQERTLLMAREWVHSELTRLPNTSSAGWKPASAHDEPACRARCFVS